MTATEEQRRILYLQAMDIPLYVSRADCPGALPTTRVPLPQSAAPVDATLTTPASAVTDTPTQAHRSPVSRPAETADEALPSKRQRSATTAAATAAATSVATTVATTAESTSTRTASTTEAVRFSLVLFRAGRWLWLEETPDGTLASDQVQLVAAMAAALDNTDAGAKVKPVTSQFKWPPHNNAQFDLGDEAARAGLEAFLQRHVDDSGCTGLIILGEAAGRRLGEASFSVPVLARTLGTRDMIMQPNLKKQVWSDIKPLVDGL